MLKKISIRKLIISFSALFTLFLIYLIPNNENDKNKLEDIPQELEYVNNDLNNIDDKQKKLKKLYYTALARERYGIYRQQLKIN